MREQSITNLYAARPDLYDLMHGELTEDARFLHEFVQTLGDDPAVLEVGCGTGRLLGPMLEAGARVTGVDLEPAMLAVARRVLARYGDHLRLEVQDMRCLSVGGPFDLAVVGLNTFMHMQTMADQLAALEGLRRHLRPGALLLLDLANPHSVIRDMPVGLHQHRFTRPVSSPEPGITTLWSVSSGSSAEQIVHSLLFFDEVNAGTGTVRRTVAEVMLRLIYRFELELLLARSGFGLRALYGDYQSSPFEDDSERLIAVAAALA